MAESNNESRGFVDEPCFSEGWPSGVSELGYRYCSNPRVNNDTTQTFLEDYKKANKGKDYCKGRGGDFPCNPALFGMNRCVSSNNKNILNACDKISGSIDFDDLAIVISENKYLQELVKNTKFTMKNCVSEGLKGKSECKDAKVLNPILSRVESDLKFELELKEAEEKEIEEQKKEEEKEKRKKRVAERAAQKTRKRAKAKAKAKAKANSSKIKSPNSSTANQTQKNKNEKQQLAFTVGQSASTLGNINKKTNANLCPKTSDEDILKKLQFESCKEKDIFFDNKVSKVGEKFPSPSSDTMACIWAAQSIAIKKGQYGSCPKDNPNGRPKGPKTKNGGGTRPCISNGYTLAIASAFEAITDCLGMDFKEIFPLITHESRFHTTSLSASGSAGLGQFSKIGIDDFDGIPGSKRGRPHLFRKKLEKSLKSCGIDTPVKPPSSDKGNRCSMMSPPDGMLRNIAYTVQFIKGKKKIIKSQFNRALKRKSNRKKIEEMLNQIDGPGDYKEKRWYRNLMLLSHNSGGSIGQDFIAFAEMKLRKGQKITPEDIDPSLYERVPGRSTYNFRKGSFFDFLKDSTQYGLSRSELVSLTDQKSESARKIRVKEISHYLPRSIDDTKAVQKFLKDNKIEGVKCSI
jgi:hypothetical protein